MPRFFRALTLMGLLVSIAFSGSATAQDADDRAVEEGLVNAMVFRPLAPGATLQVRALDNSDQNLVLKAGFERALTSKGYRINADSPIILSFETRNVVGSWSDSGRRSILELEGHGGRMGGEDAKARVNLFNTQRGGLFNKGQGETNIVTHGRYRMDVTLDDRSSGKRLWQAWAESDLGRYQGAELLSAMVPVITSHIGQTVRRQPFKLP